MPPTLALLVYSLPIFFAFRAARSRNPIETRGLIWPTIWYLVVASHPVGFWLQEWGVPIPADSGDPTEGSSLDRYFYLTVTFFGLRDLARSRFSWGAALRSNPWLVALLVYMALSIVWSQYPFVSSKRFIKVIGSIVMALVILNHANPLSAFSLVIRRVLYIHLPMSILCTRYFRDIGVTFDWNGTTELWNGIATTKNVLGQVTVLAVVLFSWEIWRRWREVRWRNIDLLYLLMALYLLKGSGGISMTSISVCVFALGTFLFIHAWRSRPELLRPFVSGIFFSTVCAIIVVAVHSVTMFSTHSLFGRFITLLGRDITMTGRTDIWHDVYTVASRDPLLGIGYGGFWIGRVANIPWNARMSWVLGQAHNGYVDTYLQLGIVGVVLLMGLLVSTVPRLLSSLRDDFDFGALRITLFLTIVFVNITESVYLRGDHHLWLVLMVVLWTIPQADGAKVRDGLLRDDAEPAHAPQEEVYV